MTKTKIEESNSENELYHIPVLFNEVLDGLKIKPNGIYVDCTFGGGGHSLGILKQLNNEGKLVAFDQDKDAVKNVYKDDRIVFIHQNFKYLQKFLQLHKIQKVDGLLADLGVSSHQFDEGSRGFSIRFDGPLDMRMDSRQQTTASDVLKQFSENQLHKMFELYGEVTNAKTLAKYIVTNRNHSPIQTIEQFKSLISSVVKGNPNKYFAQVFQALRIEVNQELSVLEEMLGQLPNIINKGGRVVIITFHSLEDRIVKQFFKGINIESENPFENNQRKIDFKIITKKPIIASKEESKNNRRSRSAKLRIFEKL